MPRLTENVAHPLSTFKRCQLCGFEGHRDICEFRMWVECDEQDKPEPGNVLVVCRGEACRKAISDHPRLYIEVPWGEGLPGHFMLLCGDCAFRKGVGCTHPDLKSNGGAGLKVSIGGPFSNVRVCFSDGTSSTGPHPAVECIGQTAIPPPSVWERLGEDL
jgi:hypothetical protein